MELTITLAIAIIGCVLSIATFVSNRKDKSNKDIKEEQKQFDKHNLIEYRLNNIDKQLDADISNIVGTGGIASLNKYWIERKVNGNITI